VIGVVAVVTADRFVAVLPIRVVTSVARVAACDEIGVLVGIRAVGPRRADRDSITVRREVANKTAYACGAAPVVGSVARSAVDWVIGVEIQGRSIKPPRQRVVEPWAVVTNVATNARGAASVIGAVAGLTR
jgi:hypothetical protein